MEGVFPVDLVSTGIRTAAMLFIVLGFLVLLLYTLKRASLFKRGAKGDIQINLLSSLHLSPKERVAVVEVLGEKLVLGIAPGQISCLARLDHDDKNRDENDEEGT